jgi:hypothetical protein
MNQCAPKGIRIPVTSGESICASISSVNKSSGAASSGGVSGVIQPAVSNGIALTKSLKKGTVSGTSGE